MNRRCPLQSFPSTFPTLLLPFPLLFLLSGRKEGRTIGRKKGRAIGRKDYRKEGL
jgi:hypothetical protein